jgi:hypothetical protein
MLLFDRRIFPGNAADWKTKIDDAVNKPGSDIFQATDAKDGTMIVTNTGREPWCGAMVSNTKMEVPTDKNGKQLQYVALRVRFKWPYAIYENLARHELDLKVCFRTRPNAQTKIRNVANFSTQWNRDTGQFQIDVDPPAWSDSGYVVEDIEPDIWHDLEYHFWYNPDPDAPVFSVQSIKLDENETYFVPEEKQNVAASETNWEECTKGQIQNCIYKPGCTVIQYSLFDLWWSNQPIVVPRMC